MANWHPRGTVARDSDGDHWINIGGDLWVVEQSFGDPGVVMSVSYSDLVTLTVVQVGYYPPLEEPTAYGSMIKTSSGQLFVRGVDGWVALDTGHKCQWSQIINPVEELFGGVDWHV